MRDLRVLLRNQKLRNNEFMDDINNTTIDIIEVDEQEQGKGDVSGDGSENFEKILEGSLEEGGPRSSSIKSEHDREKGFSQFQKDFVNDRDNLNQKHEGNRPTFGAGFNAFSQDDEERDVDFSNMNQRRTKV